MQLYSFEYMDQITYYIQSSKIYKNTIIFLIFNLKNYKPMLATIKLLSKQKLQNNYYYLAK